jgi:hypothetical protein
MCASTEGIEYRPWDKGTIMNFEYVRMFKEAIIPRHYATNRKVAGSIPDEVIF